ncbi:hypothetical protein HDU97_007110 [Phlyctochytrium planicorne]|nr:hypothetical protein HDU97_007110 [Phlyctochytrium planicorne]
MQGILQHPTTTMPETTAFNEGSPHQTTGTTYSYMHYLSAPAQQLFSFQNDMSFEETTNEGTSSGAGTGKKKPGRKPIDPIIQKVKRKNQNREAQRKFRERKEVYIKELEAKIRSIEDVIKESAAERDRLTTVIMKLQHENDQLRMMLEAKGETAFNFQPLPPSSIQKALPKPKTTPTLSSPPTTTSHNSEDSDESSDEEKPLPQKLEINTGSMSDATTSTSTSNARHNSNLFASLESAMSASITTFAENSPDVETKPSLDEIPLQTRPRNPQTHVPIPIGAKFSPPPTVTAVISAANTPLISKGQVWPKHTPHPGSIEWDLAATSLSSSSDSSKPNPGPYVLPNAEDVLSRAPPGWRPCLWPQGAKEDSESVRLHTRVCCEILQTRAASLWQLRGPPPYHPVIDLIPCAEMRNALIVGDSGIDFELFAADVNSSARCIGDPFVALSWRVPPEFWHRYPIMIGLATPEYFEVGLEDPKLAKEWAVKGVGCPNPISNLVFPSK